MSVATPESRSVASTTPDALRIESNLLEDGSYGQRVLEADREAVRVLDAAEVPLVTLPLDEIATVKHESFVSGGRLSAVLKTGEQIPLAHFTGSLVDKFSEVGRGIEQLLKGEPLSINLEDDSGPNLWKGGKPNQSRFKTMLRIMAYLKPYAGRAWMLTGVGVATTLANLVPPTIMGELTTLFEEGGAVSALWGWIALWVGIVVLGAGLQVMNGRLMAYLATNISADLRGSVYRAVEFLKVSFFEKKPVGAISSRVTQDTDRVWFFLVDGLPFLLTNTLMLVGVLGYLFYINWILALAITAPLPILFLISAGIWKPISSLFHRMSQKMARVHMHLNESFSGIRVVKAFAREDHEFDKFTRRNHELRKAALEADQTWYTAFGVMTLFVGMGTVIHWALGGYFVLTDQLSLGKFITINALILLIYGPLQWFAQVNNWFSRAMAGAERIFEIIDSKPEMLPDAPRKHIDVQGEVEFKNVRFGYDKSNPVLRDISLKAKPGEMIGLVGHSGAGKSTTINLLCRFYHPDSGTIEIDGHDYRDLDLHSYREQIGMVLQDPFLFHGTIRENISYGNPGASFDEVIEAAKAANAHEFIVDKPDGYDTIVGERGARLSGGERQRISIARAILHNPRILILDEATSSVDVETERQIQAAINHLVSGRTTYAIAHRLSTLRNADKLVVLDKGNIVEMGSHEELMSQKGIFYDLVQTQSKVNEIIGI